MASTRVELRALVDEVRRGCVRYACDGGEPSRGGGEPSRSIEASPRSRLLQQLAQVEVSLSGSQHRTPAEIQAAPPEERFGLLASKQLDCRFAKCRRVGACLACTLRPCLCPQLLPLRLGHKRERSRLEHPRSRVTVRQTAPPHPQGRSTTAQDVCPPAWQCGHASQTLTHTHTTLTPTPTP
jgi:hypothetical protein